MDWTLILAIASGFVLLANAAEKAVQAYKAWRAPNVHQDERIDALEAWRLEVDRRLINDYDHLAAIDKSNRVTQRALLALLDHGIDGNNTKPMQQAREEIHDHLINR
jgi:hypothetical protein